MPRIIDHDGSKFLGFRLPKLKFPRIPNIGLGVSELLQKLVLFLVALVAAFVFYKLSVVAFEAVFGGERQTQPPKPVQPPAQPPAQPPVQPPVQPPPQPPAQPPAQAPAQAPAQQPAQSQSGVAEEQRTAELKVEAGIFKGSLTLTKSTKNYVITPVVGKQLVQNRIGDYFYVSLLDPLAKAPFFFAPGKYQLDEHSREFGASLSAFQREVMEKLKVLNAEVYVQGSADALNQGFTSKSIGFECGGKPFDEIAYHPYAGVPGYKFKSELRRKAISTDYGNQDLPFLRAKYLSCKFNQVFPNTNVQILEGSIDQNENELSRSGTFVLYVPKG
jgi:hypothetical protein